MNDIPELNFQNRHQKDLEFSITTNREILAVEKFDGPNPFRPHRIRFYSILFILEGSGNHYIDFKRLRLSERKYYFYFQRASA